MIPEEKEFIIMDRYGRDILTVRLINGESKIFIDDEEIMICHAVAITMPSAQLENLTQIESINDIIDRAKISHDKDLPGDLITSELDFFVNCSNLEAWVLHDYDTRILDYYISFPLLEALVKHKPEAGSFMRERFLQELRQRYEGGTEAVRDYLFEEYEGYLNAATVSKAERDALFALQEICPRNCIDKLSGETIRDGHVVSFSLCRVNEIPMELKDLEHMEELYIFNPKIDEFPAWLFQMPRLRKIMISSSDVTKIELPQEGEEFRVKELVFLRGSFKNLDPSIDFLSSLEGISFGRSKLERLPESFCNLTKLKSLTIKDTPFKELPESFSNLNSLEKLVIAPQPRPDIKLRPQLRELPASFSELKNLKVLDLSYNQLTEFPEQITHLDTLEELNLGANEIENIPKEIGNLKKLKILYLTSNRITKIPEEIEKLESLEKLHLNANQIEYLPNTIGNLKRLEELDIMDNNIAQLPDTIRNLTSLNIIWLGFNPVKELPDWIKELQNLWKITVNSTKIPPEKIKEYKKKFHPIEIFY